MPILHNLFLHKEGRKGCICGKGDRSLTVETIIINDEKAERQKLHLNEDERRPRGVMLPYMITYFFQANFHHY